ncbi:MULTISPECIES: hypothetical protein [Proteus]|uniref:hypothetical protein n=1 Tax=Proteus TaxID=583 RepID=UPI000D69D7F1|nr:MULTISPECIES: hypothetical protein [Proteus]MCI9726969.1 hypothetical protein [Proteus mirabilis]MCI9730727.1 hypothetical protein [Proteus mirabilis]MCI9734481.1 hypothetical protein [Proteus mirabilis]MCI9755272.1 hypothetical protein [Proteus mirabilis]MCI9759030.1 hypothetical protein [Proteus mirabilis]
MTILIYISCAFLFLFLFLFLLLKNKEESRPLKEYFLDKIILNENGLHKQGLFWFAILFPLYSSLCFIFLLGWDYPFKWDATGFNNFLNIHKFSLGILALSPILGAFVVSAHRSIQTAKQIEATEEKNKVDIYIARRNFIIGRLEKLAFFNKTNVNVIYDYFYIFDNYIDIVNKNNFSSVEKRIDAINKLTNKIKSYETSLHFKNDILNDLNALLGIVSNLSKETGLVSSYVDELKQMNRELKTKFDESIKLNNNIYYDDLYFHLLGFTYNLSQIHSSLHELFTILLLEKKVGDYLPNLEKLIINLDGDKVATEDQNNHE